MAKTQSNQSPETAIDGNDFSSKLWTGICHVLIRIIDVLEGQFSPQRHDPYHYKLSNNAQSTCTFAYPPKILIYQTHSSVVEHSNVV